MLHHIETQKHGPNAESMAAQVNTCVHCGFCLSVCPTYKVLSEEMDSPRGRIILMKGVLEGDLRVSDTLPYLDRCLSCLACVSACPSGVRYEELLAPFRALSEVRESRPAPDRWLRLLLESIVPYPGRFRAAARVGFRLRGLAGFAPSSLAPLLGLLPDRLPARRTLPEMLSPDGKRRARVALVTGCAQEVLAPAINDACLRVLRRNGVEVVVPRKQGCCGSMPLHTGAADKARRLARNNIAVFPHDVDAIITTAAGCGSAMKEYGSLFRGDRDESKAREFASRVRDVVVFLDELGLVAPPPAFPRPRKVAYHDACHLLHAQGIREAPRRLLRSIPNLELVDVPDGETCCGSAGTYNLEQPKIAGELGRRKVQNILATGAEAVIAGNIGCLVQIQAGLAADGRALPVYHTIQLLALAYS